VSIGLIFGLYLSALIDAASACSLCKVMLSKAVKISGSQEFGQREKTCHNQDSPRGGQKVAPLSQHLTWSRGGGDCHKKWIVDKMKGKRYSGGVMKQHCGADYTL